jgi:hypothetical protein
MKSRLEPSLLPKFSVVPKEKLDRVAASAQQINLGLYDCLFTPALLVSIVRNKYSQTFALR